MCSAAHYVPAHFTQLRNLPETLPLDLQAPAKDWQENLSCGLRRGKQKDTGQNEGRSPGLRGQNHPHPFYGARVDSRPPIHAIPSSTTGLHSQILRPRLGTSRAVPSEA